MGDLLIYGSYGYTGRLVAREAVDRGFEPVLAGRDADAVTAQADDLDLPARVFDLDEAGNRLADVDAVLNCAGPFSTTAWPLVEACVDTGTHYLDITGEIGVFEKLRRRDAAATEAGVTLLPGAGFDVVPTDCLAAHLAARLPDATGLELGFDAQGGVGPGTLRTGIQRLGRGGIVRQSGRLKEVPAGWRTRTIDFGRGRRRAVTVPWGDVSTAYHTTGVPNVVVYMAAGRGLRLFFRAERLLGPALKSDAVRGGLSWLVDRTVSGPDEAAREQGFAWVWGEATNGSKTVVSRLRTPHPITLTARAALECTSRVLDGDAPTGFQTPAGAFGSELVLDVEGVYGFKDEDDGR
ncbi:saccharopine dehydrogenase family protein [Halobium salinum]|uniref:Saccharopine dehydrogenase family protein n=1 Tax=Halobium salinum TaxID=1364940 RepID=A0ABD5P924_9EURY|nr:saccharopine dehydrogenase NADP-binding domain-containing protein [Halobium salinum]